MPRLEWDKTSERFYETGVSNGVLYPFSAETNKYETGVAWNGLTAVNENPTGGEKTAIFADNIKYLNLVSKEDFGCTIEAYQSPKEFDACDGSAEVATGVYIAQQKRKNFGFVYKSLYGNDTEETDYGYILHLIYGCNANPSQKSRSTVNETPEAMTLSWEVSTIPVEVEGYKPTAHLQIKSWLTDATKLAEIEDKLFGSENDDPTLLLPDEVIDIINSTNP